MTRVHRAAALLPVALLCACQDPQARARSAELERRVATLEAQVQALQRAGESAAEVAPARAAAVTARASAQNCAAELSRALEGFRRVSLEQRYPTERELNLPPACAGEGVKWEKRTAQAYAFTVRGTGGEVLARQSGP